MFSFNDVLAFSFLKGFGHNSIKQKFKFLKLIPFGIFVHFDKASRFFWNKYCVHCPICFYRKIIFSGNEEERKVSNEIQWFTNIHLPLSEDQDWV